MAFQALIDDFSAFRRPFANPGIYVFTVLIVDDEPAIVRLYRKRFERAAFVVFDAATVEDGVRQCAEHSPDLVVVDYVLPDGDGIDVIRACRMLPRPPKSIVVSGYQAASITAAAKHVGAGDVLEKGQGPSVLVSHAIALLSGADGEHSPEGVWAVAI